MVLVMIPTPASARKPNVKSIGLIVGWQCGAMGGSKVFTPEFMKPSRQHYLVRSSVWREVIHQVVDKFIVGDLQAQLDQKASPLKSVRKRRATGWRKAMTGSGRATVARVIRTT